MKNSTGSPQKIKNKTTIWSRNFIPEYLIKENTNINLKRLYTPIFIEALFTIAKIQKQSKCPSIDKWIKKMWSHTHTHTHTHIYNGILLSQNEILPFAITRMNLENIILSEIVTERQILYDFIYTNNLKKQKGTT